MDESPPPLPPALEADALAGTDGVRHAFFTREGGVSRGLYASLNCGLGSGDDPAAVAENRRRAAAALGVADGRLVTSYQVHGIDVATVAAPFGANERPKVDGMVSRTPGLALGILTADCAPVLFADAEARVIGACHAGWRGALAGIIEATIAAMERIGARRDRTRAALGPCIAQESYEVGPEFRDAFLAGSAANDAFFVASRRAEHYLFDLPGYVLRRLDAVGIAAVGHVAHDSCGEEARLFSYRRATLRGERDFGRLLSAVALDG